MRKSASMTYQDIIREIMEVESRLGLYDEKIGGAAFWRLVRSRVLDRHMKNAYGFGLRKQTGTALRIRSRARDAATSFWEYRRLVLKTPQRVENVIFAFPRLQIRPGGFVEKFTDPLIQNTRIRDSYLIFQRPLKGRHQRPRRYSRSVVHMDAVEYAVHLAAILFSPLVFLAFRRAILRTYRKAAKPFRLSPRMLGFFVHKAGAFLISHRIHAWLFGKLRPRRVFVVSREINYPILAACKTGKIPSFELQHGVTQGPTIMYSGRYDPMLDPDVFLTFGSYWKGNQFGVPPGNIVNIGWADRDFWEKDGESGKVFDQAVLVISQPTIGSRIMDAVTVLAKAFPQYDFHIRLHPQEEMEEEKKKLIDTLPNAAVVDNSQDSATAVKAYRWVIGVNSSVLFEALSLNRRVGRIAFAGCTPHSAGAESGSGMTALRSVEDFAAFAGSAENSGPAENPFYSPFDPDVVNSLLS